MQTPSQRHSRPRHSHAFTLVELLVVIAILGVLIALLIPSLSTSRAVAKSSVDQANQRGILQAGFTYAADNKNALPYSRAFEGADFTPINPPGVSGSKWAAIYSPCGPYIWGLYSASQSAAIWGTSANTNAALGFGATILGGYATSDIFFTPNEKMTSFRTENGTTYPSWWVLRKYIGSPYQTSWTQDGLQWGAWDSNSNFQLPCSYLFRMADWQTTSFDDTTKLHTSSTGPASSLQFASAIHPNNLKLDTPGFNTKAQIMNDSNTALLPLTGANVGFGDGSVIFWNSILWTEGAYSRGEAWNHTTKTNSTGFINRVPGESWSGWRTLRLNAAERYARPF